jgi:hypothetical protein
MPALQMTTKLSNGGYGLRGYGTTIRLMPLVTDKQTLWWLHHPTAGPIAQWATEEGFDNVLFDTRRELFTALEQAHQMHPLPTILPTVSLQKIAAGEYCFTGQHLQFKVTRTLLVPNMPRQWFVFVTDETGVEAITHSCDRLSDVSLYVAEYEYRYNHGMALSNALCSMPDLCIDEGSPVMQRRTFRQWITRQPRISVRDEFRTWQQTSREAYIKRATVNARLLAMRNV